MKLWIAILLVCTLLFATCKPEPEPIPVVPCTETPHTYTANIKPIVEAKCAITGCHVAGFANGDYTTFNAVKQVADNGLLRSRVLDDKTMPLTGSLTEAELNKFNCWLMTGAQNN